MTGGRAFKVVGTRPGRDVDHRRLRLVRSCVVASISTLAFLSIAASASAAPDSVSISVASPTIAAGQSTTVTVNDYLSSGDAPAYLYVYYGPAASFGCGSGPPSQGDNYSILVLQISPSGTLNAGPYQQSAKVSATLAKSYSPAYYGFINGPPGSYVFCGWLIGNGLSDSGVTLATGSVTLGVRLPHDSLVLPRRFKVSHGHYSLQFGYQLEPGTTPVTMYLAVYPKFRIHGQSLSCNNTSAREYKYALQPNGGSVTLRTPVSSRGSYGVCATLFDPDLEFKLATAAATIVGRHSHR